MARYPWLIALLLAACGTDPVTVETPDGPVRGESDGDTDMFLGIPFAKPPIGDLRFAPPVQIEPWTDTRDATHRAPWCAQVRPDTRELVSDSDEDCLYLNIWAPARSGRFPVMVWIPGGGYIIGSGSESLYDGRHLSEQRDVVAVTINYRLAAFGFMSHEALRATEASTGNYGLLDQREALRWVRRNIAAFHGDPDNVTIFGESAGAGSICMHITSPGSAGLFERAIMESGLCTMFDHPSLDEAEEQGADLSRALGCGGPPEALVECLRDKPALEILRALPPNEHFIFGEGVAWWPVVDGVIVRDQPARLLASGASAGTPIIVGANSDEATALFLKDGLVHDEAEYRSVLGEFHAEDDVDAIVDHYGVGLDPQASVTRAFTDMFICDARRTARLHTAAGGRAYHYHFTLGFYDDLLGGGAFHTSEMPFVFGNSLGLPIPPAGIPLKNRVQDYWSSFARAGDPNAADGAAWDAYDEDRDNSLRLDLRVSHTSGVRKDDCDFWDTLRSP